MFTIYLYTIVIYNVYNVSIVYPVDSNYGVYNDYSIMKQISVSKTTTKAQEPRNVRRLVMEGEGVWEVRSSRYPQLWYHVVLNMDTNQIHCGCKAWQYQSGKGLCKHMMKVMEEEVKV